MNNFSGVHMRLALRKAATLMEVEVIRSIVALQMCQSDFSVLEILRRKGPLPVNTLGKEIMLTSGSITIAVDRLEKRGLVRREWQLDDKRVCAVELTAKGRDLIKNAFRTHALAMEKAVSSLTKPERKRLAELLEKLHSLAATPTEKPLSAPTPAKLPKAPTPIPRPAPTPVLAAEDPAAVGFDGFEGLD